MTGAPEVFRSTIESLDRFRKIEPDIILVHRKERGATMISIFSIELMITVEISLLG